ncbi:DUF2167 domain-containing protein [Cohnella terricola]|nr:DUF2167 domain-containing protein [Cohnella terricola]
MEKLVLSGLTTKAGQRYEDFDASTDKVAGYGLAGLILGGTALAIAKKAGLIGIIVIVVKKFWFLVIAAGAWLWRIVRGRKSPGQAPIKPLVLAYTKNTGSGSAPILSSNILFRGKWKPR